MKTQNEAEKFDMAIRKMFTVSHDEIVKRDQEWHRKRAAKKRAKTSPASRVSKTKV